MLILTSLKTHIFLPSLLVGKSAATMQQSSRWVFIQSWIKELELTISVPWPSFLSYFRAFEHYYFFVINKQPTVDREVISRQKISSVLIQENLIPCKHLTQPPRTAGGFFPVPTQRNSKETVYVHVVFFILESSLAFTNSEMSEGLSLDVGLVQVSGLKGQVKEGNEFFSLLLECKLLNVPQK